MSEDKERQVLENTRRNRSDIHTITGNLFQIDRINEKYINNEKDVKNPFKAILIVLGVIGVTCFIAFIILNLANLVNP